MHGLHNLMSYCSTAGKAWAHLNIFWKVQRTPTVDKIFKSLVFYSSRGVLQEMLRPLKISSAAAVTRLLLNQSSVADSVKFWMKESDKILQKQIKHWFWTVLQETILDILRNFSGLIMDR